MFRHIDDFIHAFEYESGSTLKVFRNISNEALLARPHDNIRSIQRLVWHITITMGEMLGKAGLNIDCPDEHSAPLNDISTICHAYETAAKSVLEQVKTRWTDADLSTEVNMYGEHWSKGTILTVLVKHEAHHRGQLTVLMRLNGLTVPGVYGPSKEEWAAWNMASPE
jgi:uncharacterized damage-inducible protein DinB